MDTAFSWATVGLYNTFTRSMNIAKGRGIDFNFADGMICDWKNEREYRLLGYISHMSENIADLSIGSLFYIVPANVNKKVVSKYINS